MKILVVDDDLDLLALIAFALRQAGYLVVDATATGVRGARLFRFAPDRGRYVEAAVFDSPQPEVLP